MIKARDNKPGNVFLGLVHRLDRPVGGVMVFAKTSKAASRLSEQIRARTMEKHYLAVVHGLPEPSEGLMRDYLIKDKERNIVRTAGKQDNGKEALLEYYTVESVDEPGFESDSKNLLSLVKIKLITGRPHQIRVQFSSREHPLWGDSKYGIQRSGNPAIALWSYKLKLIHPVKKESMEFKSEPENEYPWTLFSKL
jgi:23S rRNA pseudouridine1911/1915/1917 synthase